VKGKIVTYDIHEMTYIKRWKDFYFVLMNWNVLPLKCVYFWKYVNMLHGNKGKLKNRILFHQYVGISQGSKFLAKSHRFESKFGRSEYIVTRSELFYSYWQCSGGENKSISAALLSPIQRSIFIANLENL
jgi:hypothetical protein